MISIYSFIPKTKSLRLDDALLASLIAFIAAGIFVGCELFLWPAQLRIIDFSTINQALIQIILPIVLVSISILWRKKILLRKTALKALFKTNFQQISRYSSIFKFNIIRNNFYSFSSVFLVIVYLLGIVKWFSEDFENSLVYYTGFTPWFAYPLLLGIVGLLAVLGIRYFGSTLPPASKHIIIAVLVFIVTMIFVGRMISFVNLNFGFIGFYENRFLIYIFLFVSLLAPIPLVKLIDQVRSKITKLSVPASIFAIISAIILSGFSSMVLYSNDWDIIANRSHNRNIPSENEWHGINYMKNVLQHDTHAFVIAPSKQTMDDLSFATPPYQFFWTPVLLNSKYPEIPFLSLSAYNLDHAYLFLHIRDLEALQNFTQSWLVEHLLPMLPVIFSNEEVTIYNITHMSYPLPHSESTMLIPSHFTDDSWLYSYDIISQSEGGNYTVRYSDDHTALDSRTVILSYDPSDLGQDLLYKYIAYVRSGGHLIVLDPNGHGSMASYISNMSFSSIKERRLIQAFDNNIDISVPFTARNVGLGTISYIDIYPMLYDFYTNKISGVTLYKMLGKVSSLLNLSKTNSNPANFQNFPSFPFFKEITGKGNTEVNTNSIIFGRNETLNHLSVLYGGHNSISIGNVTGLQINDYKSAVISNTNNNISLSNGNGLYGKFTFKSDNKSPLFNVHFNNNNATITGLSNGKRSFKIESISDVSITSRQPVVVYALQPKIYFSGDLFRYTGIPKSALNFGDYQISGKVFLSIFMSDSYTLLDHISVQGKYQRIPPYYKYDEIASLPTTFEASKLYSSPTLVRALMLIPFLIAFIFIMFVSGHKGKESVLIEKQ
jgi:hypothetical protein